MHRFPLGLFLPICVIAACNSVGTGPVPQGEFTVVDRELWSGGTVRIRSEDFRTFGENAVLDIGSATLPLSRLDQTTLQATLPEVNATVLRPVIRFASYAFPIQSVTVAGFVDAEVVPEANWWQGQLATISGEPHAIGFVSSDLLTVDLGTGVVRRYPNLHSNTMSVPGPTQDPAAWIVDPTLQGALRVVELPEGTVVDSQPTIPAHRVDAVAQASSSVWVWNTKSNELVWTSRSGPDSTFRDSTDHEWSPSPYALRLSPSGHRIAMKTTGRRAVPLLDGVQMREAVQVEVPGSAALSFSPGGDALLVAGFETIMDSTGTARVALHLVRSSDGAVMVADTVPDRIFAVGFDPVGRWIFVGAQSNESGDGAIRLLVLDRSTLQRVAAIAVPDDAPRCVGSCDGMLGIAHNRVMLFGGVQGPKRIWRFSTPR